MASTPLSLASPERLLLADFERRYAGWWTANAAAEAAQRELAQGLRAHEQGLGAPPGEAQLRRVLDLHAAAAELQREALQLLRDAPL